MSWLRRPKLQFSLRICIVLVTACGVGFAWVRSRVVQYRAEQRYIFDLNHSPEYYPPMRASLPSGEVITLPSFYL